MPFTKIAAAGIGSTGTFLFDNLNVTGVSTFGNTVVGGATTELIVSGDARVTGILTIGTSSITLDGSNNQVNVGTGVTIHHTNGVQVGGNTLHSSGLTLNTLNVGAGGTVIRTTTTGLVGIGTTNPSSQLDVLGNVNIRNSLINISLDSADAASSGNNIAIPLKNVAGNLVLVGTGSSAVSIQQGADKSISVGIGTTNPSARLQVIGNANISGILTATSFSGSGANLTGIAATTDVRTNSLVVSGVSTFTAGSLGAPSISAEGDSNTGIYFPAADTLQVVTGGNSRVRVAAGGTVFINTTNQSEGVILKAAGTSWGGGNASGTNSGRSDSQFIFDGVGLDNSGSVTPIGFSIRGGGGGVPRGYALGAYGSYQGANASGHGMFFVRNVEYTGQSWNTLNGLPAVGVYAGPSDAYAGPAASSWWQYSLASAFGIRDVSTGNYDGGSRTGQTIELGGTYGGGSPGAWGGTCLAVRIATNFGAGSSGTNIGYYADITNAGSGNNWGLYIANGGAAKPGGGSFTATSDIRVKNVIGSYARGLEEVSQLNPVKFTYNGKGETPTDNQERIGLIAQEVKEIIPEIVSTRLGKLNEGDEGDTQIMMVDPSDLVFALVNACKELKSEVASLQARLDAAGL